jgi:peroxiredoxin
MAPGLVKAFHKYKARGVAFVSLTNQPMASARSFAEKYAIPWPSGYGVKQDTLVRFGAFSRERLVTGYEVNPTLYLIGADGRIHWSDGQARLRHVDGGRVLRELEAALDQALASFGSERNLESKRPLPGSNVMEVFSGEVQPWPR